MAVILLVLSIACAVTGGIILLLLSVGRPATGVTTVVKTGLVAVILLVFSAVCILLPAGKPAVVIHI